METAKPTKDLSGSFKISLNRTDTDLAIEAEDFNTGRLYEAKIKPDAVISLTKDFFSDLKDLYDGLLEAINGTDENTTVSVTEEGTLTFKHVTHIGKKDKVFTFEVKLEELNVSDMGRLERQLVLANQKLLEYEKRIARLESFTVQNSDYKYEMISPVFDTNMYNKAQFNFTDNNKTIFHKGQQNAWYTAFAKDPLPKSGKYLFSVKLTQYVPGNYNLMIGIASNGLRDRQYCYNSTGNYSLYLYNSTNSSHLNGAAVNGIPFIPIVGSIVSVYVDLDEKLVEMRVDGQKIVRARIAQDAEFYPCVTTYNSQDSLTFI